MKRAGLANGVMASLVMVGLLSFVPGADARSDKHLRYHSHQSAHGQYHRGHQGQPRFAAKPSGHARAHPARQAHQKSRAVVQHHHYHYHPRVPATRSSVAAYPHRYDIDHHRVGGMRVLPESLHHKRP